MMNSLLFGDRDSETEVETGLKFQPKFDSNGLIPCIVTDANSNEVLMLGYMNEASLARSIETGEAWYWSRSRNKLWKKGETSGQIQKIVEIRTDCDQDAILIRVEVAGNGASCHLGYRSCFHRKLVESGIAAPNQPLEFVEKTRVFDPVQVYGKGK